LFALLMIVDFGLGALPGVSGPFSFPGGARPRSGGI
jgi:hypothetical protein